MLARTHIDRDIKSILIANSYYTRIFLYRRFFLNILFHDKNEFNFRSTCCARYMLKLLIAFHKFRVVYLLVYVFYILYVFSVCLCIYNNIRSNFILIILGNIYFETQAKNRIYIWWQKTGSIFLIINHKHINNNGFCRARNHAWPPRVD